MSVDESAGPSWTERSRRFWIDKSGQNRWRVDTVGGDPRIDDTEIADKVCEACGKPNCRYVCFVVHPDGRKALIGDRCIMRAVPPDSPLRDKIRELTGQARRTAANAASAGRRTAAKQALAGECRALAEDPRVAVVGVECPWVGHGRGHAWLAACLGDYADRMAAGDRAKRSHEQVMLTSARALCQAP
jgi:hypothetical protein